MTVETRKFSYTYCCKSLNFSNFKFKSGKMAKSIKSNLKEEKRFSKQTKSEKNAWLAMKNTLGYFKGA